MKLLSICLFQLSIGVYSHSFAQKIDPASLSKLSPAMQEEVSNHLQQSKKAKNIAFSLLAGGIILETVAVILEVNETNNDTDNGEATAAILAFTGAAAILTSVPFFIKGHRQKKMAQILVFGDDAVSMAPGVLLPHSRSLGLRMTIPIGN